MTAWSYSSVKTFEQCPKKYYHLRVSKDVKDEGSTATIYGQEVHKAAEDYIQKALPIPQKFIYIKDFIDVLKSIPGEKHCELKLGVKKAEAGFEPCGFFDADVWMRGIADLLIVNGDRGYIVDYKTSKNAKYADTKQLDLMAGAAFVHFPELKRLKSALAFVVSNEFVRREHVREDMEKYLNTFSPQLERLEGALQTNVWNPVSGPLCRFCPVKSCEHNRS